MARRNRRGRGNALDKFVIPDGFEFNFDGVLARDYRRFLDSLTELDLLESYDFFVQTVEAWPYAGDPSDPESYDELDVKQLTVVQKAVIKAFNEEIGGN
jgi:hypothetical protein